MIASTTQGNLAQHQNTAKDTAREWLKAFLWTALLAFAVLFLLPGLAHATGSGGAAQAQARVNNVALGWQNIVVGCGVAVLTIAWSFIGYSIAFNGKTMKDLQNPAIGSTVAGLAPILVGWLFS
uniref:TrbC/VirB2 family protein n=1 Tax=Acidovorax sp. SUPP3334 TaxID=2920881 RepID=UPI0029529396|nr:TrbC/VirB2 family protein [Acidovorax sp. SUPP3334]BDH38365.1 TrbC/VirB2 family protein [Acidovorax sp. SUPP3334]